MRIDLQINQGSAGWSQITDATLAAERAGFDTVWLLDHFSGAAFQSDAMYECFTCLGALAQATSRVRLGSLVANVFNRSAAMLGLAATSVQRISSGRFVLGVGAGASPTSAFADEQHVLGHVVESSMQRRHERVVEVVEEIRGLLNGDRPAEFAGFPVVEPMFPVVVGVNSVELARHAGRIADGVNVRASHPRWREFIDVARDSHAVAFGDHPFDVSVWSRWDPAIFDASHPRRREWSEAGVNRLILVPQGAPDVGAIGLAQLL